MNLITHGLALSAAVVVVLPAAAQPAAPMIVRGAVTAVSATQLTIKPKRGPPVVIGLTPDWTVSVTRPLDVAQIKPGSFIGTAEMPKAEGVGRSLEVHVFPPGVKIGEGHYAWDLKKGSKMTNGTVGKVTTVGKSRELQVSYQTGVRRIVVPPKTPIVEITPGARDAVKAGSRVFIIAGPKPGGGLITNAVSVGVGGAAPPM